MLNQEQIDNYSNMSIRKLDDQIRKNGFTYRLIKRNPVRLMYSQHNESGKIVAYEVFLNKIGDLHKAKLRFCKIQHKEFKPEEYEKFYEIFPGDEEFGKRAWSYKSLDEANKAFDG